MTERLNDGPHFAMAAAAVDAVDTLLALKPEIPGLVINSGLMGFTHIDAEGNCTTGIRRERPGDSDYGYALHYIASDMSRLQRAEFMREGFLLYLVYQTEPLDEIPALQVIVDLGKLALDQKNA